MISKQEANAILEAKIANQNLRKHHYAVAAAMRALADEYGGDPGEWEVVGLLHDADYAQTKDDPDQHAALIAAELRERGISEEIARAVESHNYDHTGVMPETPMEWSLVACDDLTGLIVAVALVHPHGLSDVSVDSVMKKFDSSSFAAGADRERMLLCEEHLDTPIEDFVGLVLGGMKSISDELGL